MPFGFRTLKSVRHRKPNRIFIFKCTKVMLRKPLMKYYYVFMNMEIMQTTLVKNSASILDVNGLMITLH